MSKGSGRRPEAMPNAYSDGWIRIFNNRHYLTIINGNVTCKHCGKKFSNLKNYELDSTGCKRKKQ